MILFSGYFDHPQQRMALIMFSTAFSARFSFLFSFWDLFTLIILGFRVRIPCFVLPPLDKLKSIQKRVPAILLKILSLTIR